MIKERSGSSLDKKRGSHIEISRSKRWARESSFNNFLGVVGGIFFDTWPLSTLFDYHAPGGGEGDNFFCVGGIKSFKKQMPIKIEKSS